MNKTSIEWTDTTLKPEYEEYGPSYSGRRNVRLARPVSKTGAARGARVMCYSGLMQGTLLWPERMYDSGKSGLSWLGWWVEWDGLTGYRSWLNGNSMQLIVEAALD